MNLLPVPSQLHGLGIFQLDNLDDDVLFSAVEAAALAHVSGTIISRERCTDTGHFGFDLHSRLPIRFVGFSQR